MTNQLFRFAPEAACTETMTSYLTAGFEAEGAPASDCKVQAEGLPASNLFEQVHLDSGYADDSESVQGDHLMDERAALLLNRTDCGIDSELNFDALLLGGYLCHTCLPDNCRNGGKCSNVQWEGYTCDNEYHIASGKEGGWVVREGKVDLVPGRTYRLIVDSVDKPLSLKKASGLVDGGVTQGVLLVTVDKDDAPIALMGPDGETAAEITISDGETSGDSTQPSAAPSSGPGLATFGALAFAAFHFKVWVDAYFA
jgi:hypothetical protein